MDWTAIMDSPLVKGIPTAIVIGLLAWVATEGLSFVLPSKWRPVAAIVIGIALGYSTHRAGLVDFGAGEDGWLRALVFGFLGGALAPMSHNVLKDKPPFSWLTKVTPSMPPAGGGS